MQGCGSPSRRQNAGASWRPHVLSTVFCEIRAPRTGSAGALSQNTVGIEPRRFPYDACSPTLVQLTVRCCTTTIECRTSTRRAAQPDTRNPA